MTETTCSSCRAPVSDGRCANPFCVTNNQPPATAPGVTATVAARRRDPTFVPAPAEEHYLGQRLRYGPVDAELSGTVSLGMVLHVMGRWFVVWLMLQGLAFSLGIMFIADGGFTTLFALSWLGWLASCAFLLVPMRLPVSEWHWVVDGRAAAAPSAYAAIAAVLAERQTPADVEHRRLMIALGSRSRSRNYLRLRDGRFTAYVSTFGYGADLFVGWTMWWESLPIIVFFEYLRSMAAAVVARGTFFHQVLRGDRAKAFRDVVHAATREGVDAAYAGTGPERAFRDDVATDKVPSWV
ncbi:MAG TPA: hypothetical protein VGX28_13635 [Frankiaceae bacterium]|jgi:hypothetical protein|nr:hypothetical protein [Frankiaceae bacterium]